MRLTKLQLNFIIAALAALLFIPFLGAVHLFDWDEVNFAECAREMLATKDYFTVQINFLPFWEKPPLFIWLSAGSMNIFGINEFAARFPNALCGIITLVTIFNIGTRLYDRKMGLLWVLCYAGSTLPLFYFKSGIIDPWFNLFIFLGIFYFILFSNKAATEEKSKLKHLILSATFIGLAMLTKGPVAFLIAGLCIGIYLLLRRFKKEIITLPQIFLYGFVAASIGGLWFLLLVLTGKSAIITDFFEYQVRLFQTDDSGHGGPFLYHFIVLLLGCFPASVFLVGSFKRNTTDTPFQKHFKLWMMIMFWVVLLLFSIVKTKIIHYSSLCYFPLTFLSAYTIYGIINGTLQWKKWMNYLLIFTGGLIAVALIIFPFLAMFKDEVVASGMIGDKMFIENLKANVHWSGWESLIGFLSLFTIIAALLIARRKKYTMAVVVLFLGNMIAINFALVVLTGKIEQYTQGAVIDFYKSCKGRDCYVRTYAYKSYAQYFYSDKQPVNPSSSDIDWLLRGPIDKPVFIICKFTKADEVKEIYPELKLIQQKNGFMFYMRLPAPAQKNSAVHNSSTGSE